MRFPLLLLLFVVAQLACGKDEPAKPPDEHPPIAASEIDRGQTLCQRYMERVCACAVSDPTLKDACDLAKSEPEAVKMHLEVLNGAPLADIGNDGKLKDGGAAAGKRPPLNDNERRLTEASLRKVVAGCVDLDAQLPKSCPRQAEK